MLIYVADDHELVAEGVKQVLQSINDNFHIVSLRNGKELIDKVMIKTPNLVFLDIEMPVLDGVETLKILRAKKLTMPIIMLSMVDEGAIIKTCMDYGANGYMHKDSSREELKQAIEDTLNGKFYLSSQAQKMLLGLRRSVKSENNVDFNLTKREEEILSLICEGLSSKEIGTKLFISHRTVESHKENVMTKLGVNSTAKLVSMAIKNQLI